MENVLSYKQLLHDIYGISLSRSNIENLAETKEPIVRNKEKKCKHTACLSYHNKQDLPYYQNLKIVDTLIIAESPGKSIDDGKVGAAFGLHDFMKDIESSSKYYYNYFFKLLNLNPETTYITDALKCHTDKNKISKSFEYCNKYLQKEIEIIAPQRIILVTSHSIINNYIKKIYSGKIISFPHPSPQNINKILTVANLFSQLGEELNKPEYCQLGKDIHNQYKAINIVLRNKKQ